MSQQKIPHVHAGNSASIKVPHKHAELIKAWADGATIQCYYRDTNRWHDVLSPPMWVPSMIYRIKPEPKPDEICYRHIRRDACSYPTWDRETDSNVMFVFDGETGTLKDCQILAKE